ncbi:unnamed protein product [Notodromas monacha]|uniref:Rab-GAP TBC domain-containing protein n=1 Tax=Notodromas monacha TaxID=399045 RepID=A0A7R9BMJ3_9CRUS|nr:unnamed protein product [Notodromas monacha]CAG0917956.1 unnamed protein product [Notodromas monacha]
MLTVPSLGTLSTAYQIKNPANSGSYLYTHPRNFFDSPLMHLLEPDALGPLQSSAERSSRWVFSGGQADPNPLGSPSTTNASTSNHATVMNVTSPASMSGSGQGSKNSAAESSSGSTSSVGTTDSLYFEVRYVGRIRVSQSKGPPSFIEDALEKLKQVESQNKSGSSTTPQQQHPQQSQQQQKPNEQTKPASTMMHPPSHPSTSSLLAAAKAYLPSSPKRKEVSFNESLLTCNNKHRDHDKYPPRPHSPQPGSAVATKPIPLGTVAGVGVSKDAVQVAVIPPTPEDRFLANKASPEVRRLTRNRTASGSEVPRSQNAPEPVEGLNQGTSDRRSAGPEDNNHRKHSADSTTSSTAGDKSSLSASASGTQTGSLQTSKNRTMVLCISSTTVSIVSPDKKSELLKRSIRDITHCSQGIQHSDHFGFICRERAIDSFVGYIFQCQSTNIVEYIMKAIQVCFQAAMEASRQELRAEGLCEYCPLAWYQRLCAVVNGLALPKAYQVLASKVDGLPEKDRDLILAKLQGGEPFDTLKQKNTLLMMLIRAHCEAKQAEHSHNLPARNNEPIEKSVSFPLILGKAKKSFLESFLKQGSTEDLKKSNGNLDDERRSSMSATATKQKVELKARCESVAKDTHLDSVKQSRILGSRSPTPADQHLLANKPRNTKSPFLGQKATKKDLDEESDDREISPQPVLRPRSTTLSTSGGTRLKKELAKSRLAGDTSVSSGERATEQGRNSPVSGETPPRLLVQTSPLSISAQNVPLEQAKHGEHSSSASTLSASPTTRLTQTGDVSSWRKLIFQRIVAAPNTPNEIPGVLQGVGSADPAAKRDWKQLKFLWKRATFKQILTKRIEAKLSSAGMSAYERRVSSVSNHSGMDLSTVTSGKTSSGSNQKQKNAQTAEADAKLCYEDVGVGIDVDEEDDDHWSLLLRADEVHCDRIEPRLLEDSVRKGVPRRVRGKVWQLLVHHTRAVEADKKESKPRPDLHSDFPFTTPYEELLKQLTAQQHAILIDLARTFPTHPYFSQPLGQGQLELFNLLKAYSILDGDVGYCQGLSFIAALIIMHMDEKSAWDTFLHVLVERDLRSHYVGNLGGLQLCLYQLSRLLVDRRPELAQHLDDLSAPPTLYASPWFLSIFTADFPVGFGVRVMDLILLQGKSALIKVALVVLERFEEELMIQDSLEDIMEYLKTTLPQHSLFLANPIIQTAADLDIRAQLLTYEIEYQVLQEEIGVSSAEAERKKDQHAKIVVNLQRHNRSLLEKLLFALLTHVFEVPENRVVAVQLYAYCLFYFVELPFEATNNHVRELEWQRQTSPPSIADAVIKPISPSASSELLANSGGVKSARMSRLSVRTDSMEHLQKPMAQSSSTSRLPDNRKSGLQRENHQMISAAALRQVGQSMRESRSYSQQHTQQHHHSRQRDLDDDDDLFCEEPYGSNFGSGSGSGWFYDLAPVPVISIKPEDYVTGSVSGSTSHLQSVGSHRRLSHDEYGVPSFCLTPKKETDPIYDGPRSNSEPNHRRIAEDVHLALMDSGDDDCEAEDDATVRDCRLRLAGIRRGIETGIKRLAEYRKSVHTAEDELLNLRRGDVFSFGAIEELASTTAKLQSAELQLKAAGDCLDKAYSHLPSNLRGTD